MAIVNNKRRQFLRSAGGYMLAIPFLPSLAEKAYAADPVIPKRFISVRSTHGQPPELFYPSSYRPTTKVTVPGSSNTHIYYRAFQNNELISDLIGENFRSVATKLSILRGLDLIESEHNNCLMLAPGHYNPGAGITASSWSTSLDEVLAASSAIYPTTPSHRILRIEPAPFGEKGYGYSVVNTINQDYYTDMNALFTTLFKNAGNGGNTSPSDPSNTKKLKAVDLTLGAYNYLKNSRQISSVDKTRLDQFYSILNDTENKLKSIQPVQQGSCNPGTNYAASNYELSYDLANDIIMLALSCGKTQVISLSLFYFSALAGETRTTFHDRSHWTFGKYGTYPKVGIEDEAAIAGLSDATISNLMSVVKRMWQLPSQKVGSLMTKMNNVVEANGKTMLDNSLVYWGNEMGGAASHGGRSSMPIVVGGTLGGLVNPGYWDYTHRPFLRYAGNGFYNVTGTIPYTNFLTTLCNLYGLPPSSYERANQGGFGDFEAVVGSNYDYVGENQSKLAATIYAEYITTAGRRKQVPGWVKT